MKRPASDLHYSFKRPTKASRQGSLWPDFFSSASRGALRWAPEKEYCMTLVEKLMLFGWIATFAMIAYSALSESGKLLKIRKTLTAWLERSTETVSDRTPQSEDEEAA